MALFFHKGFFLSIFRATATAFSWRSFDVAHNYMATLLAEECFEQQSFSVRLRKCNALARTRFQQQKGAVLKPPLPFESYAEVDLTELSRRY